MNVIKAVCNLAIYRLCSLEGTGGDGVKVTNTTCTAVNGGNGSIKVDVLFIDQFKKPVKRPAQHF